MAISVGDAVVKLGLDKTQFTDGMRKVGDETDAAMAKVKTSMRIGGAAILAVGVAGLKLVSDARKMNAELGQIAITTGSTTKDMRGLALELSNVTFRLGSVISTLDLLSRAGITNKEEMKAVANAFDALADATGSSAEAVAEILIPAYRAFGEQLPQNSADLDKFTWLTKHTLVDLSDFGNMLTYLAPEMDNLGISMEDAIAILAILDQRGISGAAATRELRQAVTEAANEGTSLNEVLGISSDLLTEYNTKLSTEAVGATKAYADAANEQYGLMDKLKSGWEDLTFVMGSALTPLEPLFGFMSALGPAILALSLPNAIPNLITNIGLLAKGFVGLVAAAGRAIAAFIVQAAAAIWAALGPWGIAGIIAAGAGVAALIASIKRAQAAGKEAALAEGGIVRRPTRVLIGEAGPEAVIPLSQAGLVSGTRELHIHVGNFMGDAISMRQFVRKIDQVLKEESRRSSFGQVNQGWYYGRSSL
jgi:hypothetical protein